MYWLVTVAAVGAWMVVARRDAPEPVVAVRPPTHQPTLSEKWKGAAGLAAMAVGKVVWIGLVLMALVGMTVGAATRMY